MLRLCITLSAALIAPQLQASVVPTIHCEDFCTNIFQITGLGGPTLEVRGSVEIFFPPGPPPDQDPTLGLTATGFTEVDFYAMGEGPVRPGLATLRIMADGESTGLTSGDALAEVSGLGQCSWTPTTGPCSELSTLVPFQLGVPFRVHIRADVQATNTTSSGQGGVGAGAIELQLFDLQGQPVNIQQSIVPEPGTFALLGFAGLVIAVARRRFCP